MEKLHIYTWVFVWVLNSVVEKVKRKSINLLHAHFIDIIIAFNFQILWPNLVSRRNVSCNFSFYCGCSNLMGKLHICLYLDTKFCC